MRLVEEEVEQHVQLVGVLVAEERALLGGRLTSPSSIASPALRRKRAGRAGTRGGRDRALGHAHRLDQERDGVDPEAGEPLLHPEADDLGDLVAHLAD